MLSRDSLALRCGCLVFQSQFLWRVLAGSSAIWRKQLRCDRADGSLRKRARTRCQSLRFPGRTTAGPFMQHLCLLMFSRGPTQLSILVVPGAEGPSKRSVKLPEHLEAPQTMSSISIVWGTPMPAASIRQRPPVVLGCNEDRDDRMRLPQTKSLCLCLGPTGEKTRCIFDVPCSRSLHSSQRHFRSSRNHDPLRAYFGARLASFLLERQQSESKN